MSSEQNDQAFFFFLLYMNSKLLFIKVGPRKKKVMMDDLHTDFDIDYQH